MGASGRLGTVLRRHWHAPGRVVWQMRAEAAHALGLLRTRDLRLWAPLSQAPRAAGFPRVDVVLCLAGVVQGNAAELSANTDLALAALEAGRALGARRVLLASSAAVYGSASGLVDEAAPPRPITEYGRAKLDMERAAIRWKAPRRGQWPALTCLRIGNVAGADALLGGNVTSLPMSRAPVAGPVLLDRFADGHGPRRSYIGPLTLARVLATLVRHAAGGRYLPEVLNIAAPGAVAMADLLRAAGMAFAWQPAPASAVQEVGLDVALLARYCPLSAWAPDPCHPVREWQYCRAIAA